MFGRFEIWNVHFVSPLVCPYKISCQCSHFCRSPVQKCPKNCVFTAFCSILTNFQMTYRPEIWYVNTPLHRVCSRKISSQCCIRPKKTFTAFLQHFFKKRSLKDFITLGLSFLL